MTIQSVLAGLEAMPFATAIRESGSLFPWLESVHVLAIVLVVGVVVVMDMRLLGFETQSASVRRVLRDATPCAWVAFGAALITGFLLFASSATTYAANPAFLLKLGALAVAGINMGLFHHVSLNADHSWDGQTVNVAARAAGIVSLCAWFVVVAAGRWIGFMA